SVWTTCRPRGRRASDSRRWRGSSPGCGPPCTARPTRVTARRLCAVLVMSWNGCSDRSPWSAGRAIVNSQTVHTRAASLPIDAVRGRRYVSFVAHSSQIPLATCADGAIAREIAASDAGEAAAAETELYRRFAPRVRLYGYKHLSDRGAADDLAQQVMLVVITRLRAGEVHEPDQIGSFVLGTSRMMVVGKKRGERRRAAIFARFDAHEEAVDPANDLALD